MSVKIYDFYSGFLLIVIQIVIIVSLSVTVAMYCLIQLYVVVSDLLSPYRPLLKLFAIKAVGALILTRSPSIYLTGRLVFLTFWQASFLSLLSMVGVVKDVSIETSLVNGLLITTAQSKYMTAEDINIGIGALLQTLEMMFVLFRRTLMTSLTHATGCSLSCISGRSRTNLIGPCIHPVPKILFPSEPLACVRSVMLWISGKRSGNCG